ncbi:hypothetical protein [Xanthocytophaga agilis]|uniref:Peptidase M4 n=1 Tax=Xanthocytophaga agilis TaxID=3048010 RepID=A0AAE3R8Z1_9BACT|nr:hypothetical protein [Xanthocytophaga agilis]MDJ1503599.1 hypothetical protein [Xanthocytophaga agilis]
MSPSNTNVSDSSLQPIYRRLRGYAFDPSFATKLDALDIDTVVYHVKWEKLKPGPIGEYIEVIDIDPASSAFYPPVNLEDPELIAQDGLPPSESNPQFHQQMVYAVAMLTIQNFEKALGRPAQWSSTDYNVENGTSEQFVKRLRLYPHAIRDANAYYSQKKKAVLFGYFSAKPNSLSLIMPNSLVFTCLSHDIVAHEVTHALIDGIYKRYVFPYHEDTLALHEAIADLVALFQHFTFTEIIENQIARTRGKLTGEQLLSQLAQQFGIAIGNYHSLRDAIGSTDKTNTWTQIKPDPKRLQEENEAHGRGSILVAAIFDAFLNIYKKRTSDLYRIASNGTGILLDGEIHPDLTKRLAYEASRTAKQFLSICIRALDYCPPAGTSFGELLRAMITADLDLVPNDLHGYRIALIESFRKWGIYPVDIRTLAVENLSYYSYNESEVTELGSKVNTTEDAPSKKLDKRIKRLIDDIEIEQHYLYMDDLDNGGIRGDIKRLVQKVNDLIQPKPPKSKPIVKDFAKFRNLIRDYFNDTAIHLKDRENLFELSMSYKRRLHNLINSFAENSTKIALQNLTCILIRSVDYNSYFSKIDEVNLVLKQEAKKQNIKFPSTFKVNDMCIKKWNRDKKKYEKGISFEIHSLHRAQRVGPDANVINQVIMTLMQTCTVGLSNGTEYEFRGGCTVVINIDLKTIRFINKGILKAKEDRLDYQRLARELCRRYGYINLKETESPFSPSNWPEDAGSFEPFALLHRNH